jgi:hypothetical protein
MFYMVREMRSETITRIDMYAKLVQTLDSIAE